MPGRRDMVTPLHGKLGGNAAAKAMVIKQLSWTPCALVAWTVLLQNRGPVVLAERARRASGWTHGRAEENQTPEEDTSGI